MKAAAGNDDFFGRIFGARALTVERKDVINDGLGAGNRDQRSRELAFEEGRSVTDHGVVWFFRGEMPQKWKS
jgi:hypothetical protein